MLRLAPGVLEQISAWAEAHYPEETAGLLLGVLDGEVRVVLEPLALPNQARDEGRRNRYLLDPVRLLAAEEEAERRGLQVLGVYHSHPDHPAEASDFDLQWALPWFSYLIVSVRQGTVVESRSWCLSEDRSRMLEEHILIETDRSSQEKP